MYSNPIPVSVYRRDKDRRPRIFTAGWARQRGDSNESSLTLSWDKRRGRVAVTRRIRPCIPVRFPSFLVASTPFAFPPPLSFVCRSIHCVCNTALFPHPSRSHEPISPAFARFLFVLSSSSHSYLIAARFLPSLHHRPPPASFVLLFCRRARSAGISLLLQGTPLSSPCDPAYKHRGFIWTFYSGRGPCRSRRPTGITPKESRTGADSRVPSAHARAWSEDHESTAYASSIPSWSFLCVPPSTPARRHSLPVPSPITMSAFADSCLCLVLCDPRRIRGTDDKTSSLSSLQNRKKKRKRTAKVVCMLQPDLFPLVTSIFLQIFSARNT